MFRYVTKCSMHLSLSISRYLARPPLGFENFWSNSANFSKLTDKYNQILKNAFHHLEKFFATFVNIFFFGENGQGRGHRDTCNKNTSIYKPKSDLVIIHCTGWSVVCRVEVAPDS